MLGRAGKGIMITTGTFSQDAICESVRDGVSAIELVDGNDLIDMFGSHKFGLVAKTTFEIDGSFFRTVQ